VPDWDGDSARLTENLVEALRDARDAAARRRAPDAAMAKRWHALTMRGLEAPHPRWVSGFRGEPGLEGVEVGVGARDAVPAREVAGQLERFVAKLTAAVDVLDGVIAPGTVPRSEDDLNAVLEVCGWAHAEWVRIHPFANGNGRTARLWVNYVAMRYRLPPLMRLRLRPGAEYADAAARAMEGEWRPMVRVVRRLYLEAVRRAG
jgi:hypothetical protein